jgi:vancomycin resistance protein YoaR
MLKNESSADRTTAQQRTDRQRRVQAGRAGRVAAQRRRHRAARVVIQLLATFVLLLLLSAIAGLIALDRAYSGRIITNVAIQGLDLSQLEPGVARAALRSRYGMFLKAPITFEFEGRTWRPTPEQIGVRLMIDDAVDRAYGAGRGADLFTSIPEALAIWRNGLDLPVQLVVDQRQLQQYLAGIARDIERAPQNASLQVLKGQLISSPATIGRQLLIDDTVHASMVGFQNLQPQTITLRTRALHPLIEDTGIAEAQHQLSGLLQGSATLKAANQSWTWSREELGALVQIARVPSNDGQTQRLVAMLDRTMLERQIQPFSKAIDLAPIEPRLHFTAKGLQITRAGQNGAQLEVAQAVDQLNVALWQNERTVELPVTILQPQARPDTLAKLGIDELVAQGKSSFEASAAYRVTNIQAGARQMEGVLIAPGQEFSFDQTVGAIDESNGFTEGYAIIDGRTQQEWGGGVCQVSTTVFRAAFWAGIPITERNQHSFRIRWYEKFEPIGMDAAIFTGPNGYDLRFVNDTGHWLLMETVVDTTNEVLTVNLYGTKSNREVIQTQPVITKEIPAPTKPRYVNDPKLPAGTLKQTDTARGGMDVQVGRIVKENGAVLYKDTFFSRFQPWPNIYARGTG